MANCKTFQQLTPLEKSIYIGKLVHATSNDEIMYELGEKIIELAELKGVFEGVTIHPQGEDISIANNLN